MLLLLLLLLLQDAADASGEFSEQEMEDEISHRMESVPEDLMSTLYPFQVEV